MDITDKKIRQIKKEYREILNKYHPDLSHSRTFEKMKTKTAYVTRYYQVRIRYLEQDKGKKSPKADKGDKRNSDNKVPVTKDPAYAFYRHGIEYYRQIQPDSWIYLDSIEDFFFSHSRLSSFDEQKRLFNRIFENFQKSLNYFMMVISEHPACPWADDSKRKIINIGRLLQRYRKIRESIEKEMN